MVVSGYQKVKKYPAWSTWQKYVQSWCYPQKVVTTWDKNESQTNVQQHLQQQSYSLNVPTPHRLPIYEELLGWDAVMPATVRVVSNCARSFCSFIWNPRDTGSSGKSGSSTSPESVVLNSLSATWQWASALASAELALWMLSVSDGGLTVAGMSTPAHNCLACVGFIRLISAPSTGGNNRNQCSSLRIILHTDVEKYFNRSDTVISHSKQCRNEKLIVGPSFQFQFPNGVGGLSPKT